MYEILGKMIRIMYVGMANISFIQMNGDKQVGSGLKAKQKPQVGEEKATEKGKQKKEIVYRLPMIYLNACHSMSRALSARNQHFLTHNKKRVCVRASICLNHSNGQTIACSRPQV